MATDEDSLASLATASSANAIVNRAKKAAKEANRTHAGSSATGEVDRRPRMGEDELLRDAIIGFVEDADDPVQQGDCPPRQSKEIDGLVKASTRPAEEIPMGKEYRHMYIWVAKGITHGRHTNRRYTINENNMLAGRTWAVREDNTCDVCGACATEELYEFRCYSRRTEGTPTSQRRLHPFIAYISKKCGKGLLGVQSEASKIVEQLTNIINKADVQALQELMRCSTDLQKRVIEERLRILAKAEIGETDREAEIKRTEKWIMGSLTRFPTDVFRAAARSLPGFGLVARDLVGLTVRKAKATHSLPAEGFLATIAKRVEDRLPLPSAPAPWEKKDVEDTLSFLTTAVPIRVVLKDIMSDEKVFESGTTHCSIDLVYLSGCRELHGLAQPPAVEGESLDKLKTAIKADLTACRQDYKSIEQFVGGGGTRKGPGKSQDIDSVPDGVISNDHITKILEDFNWPDCFSRANVRPEGALYISAFPMGAVLNYCKGLMCSRTLGNWPNLGKLINTWARQKLGDFPYTTIQFNKNYGAKMHVDGNNHGWSYIIGLGDYTGGELWQYDETGDHEMRVGDVLRGYSHLKVGTMARGRLCSIKNTWVKFDGNAPHAVLPFEGMRISIVFFTRQKWLNMQDEHREKLLSYGFPIPGPEYINACTEKAVATVASTMVGSSKRAKVEEEREDEVDEEEQLDAALRLDEEGNTTLWRAKSWAKQFKQLLAVLWGDKSVGGKPISVVTCHTGPAPMLALQDLVPPGCAKLATATETGSVAMKLVKQNCKPEHLFADLESAVNGKGLCDAVHAEVKVDLSSSDFLVGNFQLAPFVNRDPKKFKVSCFDDPKAMPFRKHFQHIDKYQPAAALLFITDTEVLAEKQMATAFNFILEGANPVDGEKWGLQHLGYGLEYTEVSFLDFGVPLASTAVMIALVRENAGGQQAAKNIVNLVRSLAKELPRVTLQELLFNNGDPRLLEVQQKEWTKSSKKSNSSDPKVMKKLVMEERLLGLNQRSNPYQDRMWRELGSEIGKTWFPQGSEFQKRTLDIVYETARRSGMEVDALVHDFSTDLKDRAWHDDGTLRGKGPHYLFGRHRPMLGREALLCVGLPIWRLQNRGLKDTDLLCMLSSVPVPIYGAAILSALATVSLGNNRSLTMPAATQQRMLDPVSKDVDPFKERLKKILAEAGSDKKQDEGAQFEGRAATMLSLVSHGKFAEKSVRAVPQSSETKKFMASLAQVANDEEHEMRVDVKDELVNEKALDEWAGIRDWNTRARKIRFANPKPPLEYVWSWVLEAAQEAYLSGARNIIQDGLALIKKEITTNVSKDSKHVSVPGYVKDSKDELALLVKKGGLELHAQGFLDFVEEQVALDGFSKRSRDKAIEYALDEYPSMNDYINKVLRPLTTWPTQKAFMDHLAKATAARESINKFTECDGFELVRSFLEEAPDNWDVAWTTASSTLKKLGTTYDSLTCPIYNLAYGNGAGQEMQAEILKELGNKAIKQVSTAVEEARRASGVVDLPPICRELRGPIRERFALTAEGLGHAHSFGQAAKSQELNKMQADQKIRGFTSLRANFVQRRAQNIQDRKCNEGPLAQAEDAFLRDQEQVLKDCRDKAIALEEQLNKQEAERRARMQQLQYEKHCAEAEKLARQIRDLVDTRFDSGWLRSNENFKPLRELVIELNKNPAVETIKHDAGPVRDAIELAKDAARHHGEELERIALAKNWLHKQQLSHAIPALEELGLLSRLWELAAGEPNILQGSALPQRCHDSLLSKTRLLSEENFSPSSLPEGWQTKTSSSTGWTYYVTQDGRTTFNWPKITEIIAPKVPEPKPPAGGAAAEGEAKYTECDKAGQRKCLLCEVSGLKHFRSEEHGRIRDAWVSLTAELEKCAEASKLLGATEKPWLGTTWVREALECVNKTLPSLGLPASFSNRMISIFWHRVVRSVIPATSEPKVTSANALQKKFSEMLTAARLDEPSMSISIPKPGIDFTFFPAQTEATRSIDAETLPEVVEAWNTRDLFGEGILRKKDGWHCGYCEQDLTDLSKHILPYYNEGKRHKRNLEVTRDALASLKDQGWKLVEEGITVKKKQFFCEPCSKEGAWYSFRDHLVDKKHKAFRTSVSEKAAAADQEAWARMFDEVEKKAEIKVDEPPKPKLPPPAAAAIAPRPTRPKAPAPALAPAPAPAPKKTWSVPPLPTSPADFPACLTQEKDALNLTDSTPDADVLKLSAAELMKEGIEVRPKGGSNTYWCYYCYCAVEPEKLAAHLKASRKDGKYHVKCRDLCIQIVQRLAKEGSKLARNGVTLKNHNYECRACSKNDAWYTAFDHIETGKHQKALHYIQDTLPPPPDEQERIAWVNLITSASSAVPSAPKAASAGVAAASAPKAASVRQPENIPAAKRPLTETADSPSKMQKVVSASAAPPSKVPKVAPSKASPQASPQAPPQAIKVPSGLEWLKDVPTEADLTSLAEKAKQQWYPPLTKPLYWGHTIKKKGFFIWCSECRHWVGWGKVGAQSPDQAQIDTDGACPHYTAEARANIKAAMMKPW